MRVILFLICSGWAAANAALELRVRSYNVGLAHYGIIDLVPCRATRRPYLVEAIIDSFDQGPQGQVVALQEAWDKDFFEAAKYHALRRGLDIQPRDYAQVHHNGLVVISDLSLISHSFHSFGEDLPTIARGLMSVEFQFNDHLYTLYNTHTVFSGLQGLSDTHVGQLSEITRHLAGRSHRRAILAGDFNFGSPFLVRGDHHRQIEAEHLDWTVEMNRAGFREAKLSAYSWDAERNVLITAPTVWLEVYTLLTGGHEWKQVQSNIDQIWYGDDLKLMSTALVFEEAFDSFQKNSSFCPRDANGLTPMSDHFGVEAKLLLVE